MIHCLLQQVWGLGEGLREREGIVSYSIISVIQHHHNYTVYRGPSRTIAMYTHSVNKRKLLWWYGNKNASFIIQNHACSQPAHSPLHTLPVTRGGQLFPQGQRYYQRRRAVWASPPPPCCQTYVECLHACVGGRAALIQDSYMVQSVPTM